jgi:hypothetical protein
MSTSIACFMVFYSMSLHFLFGRFKIGQISLFLFSTHSIDKVRGAARDDIRKERKQFKCKLKEGKTFVLLTYVNVL